MKSLKNHEEALTKDGSKTLYSKRYDEHCHSLDGANEETLTHYIQSCQVLEKSKTKGPFHVLEVGFGAGIGLKMTAQKVKTPAKFTSFEIDPELIKYFLTKQKIDYKESGNIYSFKYRALEVQIIQGDALKTISQVEMSADCIYQDAFSPKKNPELWTVEWFQSLKELANEDCIMSTYSASSSIRKSMIEAGWKINPGQRFGNKRASTIAKLEGHTHQDILDHLDRSPTLPLYHKDIPIYLQGKLLKKI